MKRIHHLIFIISTIAIFSMSTCGGGEISLDGSSWNLNSYQSDVGEMVSVLPGSTNTALFQGNHVSGIAGCNNYSADYQVDGKDLSFGPVATTRKTCSDPSGIMQQEGTFLSALSVVTSYELVDNSLEMFDNQGDSLLKFTRAGE